MTALSRQDFIENLDLPTRILNPLKRCGLRTIKDLIQKDVEFFLGMKGFGIKSIFFLNKKLQEKFGKTITIIGSKPYNKRVERQYLEDHVHIFRLNFEKIFYAYKKKKKTSHLDELEDFLTKPNCYSELYSGKITFSSFENADMARKFSNYSKTRIFKRNFINFAHQELGLTAVIDVPDKYWKEYKTGLMQILDSILESLNKKGCFGKFNPYAVFLLISSYNNIFDNNKLASRLLFFKNLNQFFRCEDKILGRPIDSPFRMKQDKEDNVYRVNPCKQTIEVSLSEPTISQRSRVERIRAKKTRILEIIAEIQKIKINRIVFSNINNGSFFQFAITDKNFLLDFPDYPDNGNHGKAEAMRQLLLSYQFKLVPYSLSLKEKEFAQELSDNKILIQANCGSDRYLLSELIEVFSRKILGLTDRDLLKVEYID